VTHGPQLSDIRHYKYETLNLKTYLKNGENLIAIKVINFDKRKFLGYQSIFTSLIVNGATLNADILTTKGSNEGCKCLIDKSYKAIEVNWRSEPKTIIGGFYANNPTDFVDKNIYPTNWEKLEFEDTNWQPTEFHESAKPLGGSIAYLLEPRNFPLLIWQKEHMGSIVKSQTLNRSFPFPEKSLNIEGNQKVSFLIDQRVVVSGFPELKFSGGKDAKIKISFAVNLFGKDQEKGDRDDIVGKKLIGCHDVVLSNGEENQDFTPNWMRTFRFIQFDIETQAEPL
jgi:alpha-L-rhamnosidase